MPPCSTDSCFFKYPNYVLFEEDKKMECLWQSYKDFNTIKPNMSILNTSEADYVSVQFGLKRRLH
jgi:hypothetical protein